MVSKLSSWSEAALLLHSDFLWWFDGTVALEGRRRNRLLSSGVPGMSRDLVQVRRWRASLAGTPGRRYILGR